jgi:MSHA biogenesis protein MshL
MNPDALTMIDLSLVFHRSAPRVVHTGLLAGLLVGLSLLVGCAGERPLRTPSVSDAIRNELPGPPEAVAATAVQVPKNISDVLAEPAPVPMPLLPEPRLDLLVNNAQAREVFLAIVADTRYSMLMHPNVAGTLSVTLRGVTVAEALEAIRDVYGYDFKIDGRRITVFGPTIQTRIFTVNYPNSQRSGNSDLRVTSGSAPSAGSSTGSTSGSSSTSGSGASGVAESSESSRVTTSSKTDYWSELTNAVKGIIGSAEGRNVIASPQAGILAVRAMPDELRQVDGFLKAAQSAVERQVMLEAKIVQVELRDGYQSGIDWSALKNSGKSTGALGVLGGNPESNGLIRGVHSNLPGFAVGSAALADGVSLPNAGTGLFGLAFATEGFQAVLGFLETRGDVQILSSPRIATLNNQKAVLKVGSDEFFVTGFNLTSVNTASSGSNTSNSVSTPVPVLSSMFSGIALDVMPQIDQDNNITLHIRPSITSITEKNLTVGLGSSGDFKLPLASRSVNESDTIVRIQDGKIVAIGGLMQIESNRTSSGLPGSTDSAFSLLLGNKANSGRKKEVVVLIKPTIIRSQQDWDEQNRRTRAALDDMDTARARVIRLDGSISNRLQTEQ